MENGWFGEGRMLNYVGAVEQRNQDFATAPIKDKC